MLQRGLSNEAIEALFQLACDFARSTGTWATPQALGALRGKALHPFAESRIGQVERRGDGMDVVACDDLTDGLRSERRGPPSSA